MSDYLFLSGLSNFFLNVILVRIVQFYPIFKFVQFYSKLSNLSAFLFLSGLSNFVPTPKYSLLSETSSLPDCRILFRISVRILRIFEFCPKCYFFRYFFFFRTILLSVVSLLNEPNTYSPANVDASVMFRRWKDSKGKDKEYENIIR